MKRHLLSFCALAFSGTVIAQNCLELNAAGFSNPSNDGTTWNLNVSFTANGNKALKVNVSCGTTLILDTCFITNGSGSASFTGLICPGGSSSITATFIPHTGNCNSATCAPVIVEPPTGGPLPVNLNVFYAQRKNSTVSLRWQTASEINASEFVIQRFTRGGFVDVATVAARNIPTGSSYAFSDINSFRGVSQYRLKMLDLNGTFRYSDIRAVKGEGAGDFVIFPNPASGRARVMIPDISGPTDVQLVDNAGRLLKVVSLNNSNIADFDNLQRGMYFVRIIDKNSGQVSVKRLSVMN